MIKKYPYWHYVVGVFVVWAIVLLVAHHFLTNSRFDGLLVFGCGFLLGVLGACGGGWVYR